MSFSQAASHGDSDYCYSVSRTSHTGQDREEVGQDGEEVGQDGEKVGQDGEEVGQDGEGGG